MLFFIETCFYTFCTMANEKKNFFFIGLANKLLYYDLETPDLLQIKIMTFIKAHPNLFNLYKHLIFFNYKKTEKFFFSYLRIVTFSL